MVVSVAQSSKLKKVEWTREYLVFLVFDNQHFFHQRQRFVSMFIDSMFCLMLHSQKQLACDSTTGYEFLFAEEKVGRLFVHKYIGVSSDCDDNLSLIKSTDFRDRRCKFSRLIRRSR